MPHPGVYVDSTGPPNGYVESCYTSTSDTGDVWYHWNIVYANSTAATTTLNLPEGHTLVSSTTASTTSSAAEIWTVWNDRYFIPQPQVIRQQVVTRATTTVDAADPWNSWIRMGEALRPIRVSEEERRAREEENARRRRIHEEAEAKRKEAEVKAEKLLEQVLSPEQRDDLKKKGCFYLHTNGRKYRVDRGWAGNVKLLDETDQPIEQLCIHPRQQVPVADNLVAQKLMLEANEQEFRRVANITRLRH